jgi:peptidoglycan/xylan/chitin deacetylase (PgdA/CDA1 family)
VPLLRLLPLPVAAAVLVLGACTSASPSASGSSSGSAEPSLPSAPASQSPATSVPPGGASYTVQNGDTLTSIAGSWGTTVALLQAWNVDRYPSLATDPGTLQVGWVLVVDGDPNATPLPTPVATPAPTPPASGCRAGNHVAAGSQQTFTSIPSAGHAVALTFDMGGRLDPGVDILNLLIANHVCATIFPTGAMTQTIQGQAVMAVIKAHPELFEVGNHTMHHCDLVHGGLGSPTTAPCATGGTPTADFIRKELTDAAAIVKQYSGQDPVPYWRPPYGAVNDFVRSAAASVGYTKTFMWSVDTIDWKPISDGGPTASQISAKVVSQATDGGIVLMHLGGYETFDALRTMIPGLRDRGFLLTSVSDLLN